MLNFFWMIDFSIYGRRSTINNTESGTLEKGMGRYNFQFYFACPILQMLTSKDANFIGYTFKKSDIMKSIGTSGLLLPELAIDFKFLIVYLVSHFGLLSSDQPDDQNIGESTDGR
ncbi:hypothetical protein CK203_081478 [Vitis vinifera]|uniref:Uncharacterized protein n=1 Tax=Vitis vinifera TaxID=29760 RepID=A0A438DYI7_VITVI|nr:hypothetical protein CK203_081478 [Vitis vinifera]